MPDKNRRCRRCIPMPPIIFGGASIVAYSSNYQMLHALVTLRDGSTESVVFHRNSDDLALPGSDMISDHRIGNYFLTRRNNTMVERRPILRTIGTGDTNLTIPFK